MTLQYSVIQRRRLGHRFTPLPRTYIFPSLSRILEYVLLQKQISYLWLEPLNVSLRIVQSPRPVALQKPLTPLPVPNS